jgi:hypothetical protein
MYIVVKYKINLHWLHINKFDIFRQCTYTFVLYIHTVIHLISTTQFLEIVFLLILELLLHVYFSLDSMEKECLFKGTCMIY